MNHLFIVMKSIYIKHICCHNIAVAGKTVMLQFGDCFKLMQTNL